MALAFQVLLAVLVTVAVIGVIAHFINQSQAANIDADSAGTERDKPA